ncbi:hypothetical protein IJM16_03790 [Candidatus Saccharibacteria bacterium]|nr:hypothetical protein [Candidatus Saccharibacteria bacterium]
MFINMFTLVKLILADVRHICHTSSTRQGAVGISFVPQCEDAMHWIGVDTLDVMVNYIYPIWPRQDTILDDDAKIYGDAASVVMKKIASARIVLTKMQTEGIEPKTHLDYSSANLPEKMVSRTGFTKEKGGIAFPIYRRGLNNEGKIAPFMTIYVAVATGASEDIDDRAAWEAVESICRCIVLEEELVVAHCCTI